MLDLNRIFSHRPEAAATISFRGRCSSIPPLAGLWWWPSFRDCRGTDSLACTCTRAALAARSGNHLMAQATTGVSQVSGIPGIWGIFPSCCLRMGEPGAPFGPVGFSPVRPGVTPSSSTVWQTTTAPNRQGTPERGSVVASYGSYFSLSRRCR